MLLLKLFYSTSDLDPFYVNLRKKGPNNQCCNFKFKIFFLILCFFQASYAGHQKVVEILLLNGANVNIQNRGGVTPLHEGII